MIHTVYTVYTWSQIRVSKTEEPKSVVRLTLPPRSVVPPSEARTTSAPAEWATWQAWVQAVWKKRICALKHV